MNKLLYTLLIAGAVTFTGCSTLKKLTTNRVVETVPVEVQKEIVTTTPDGLVTNVVTETNYMTVTNTVPSKTLTGGIKMVASNLPIPGGGLIGEAVTALLVGGFGFVNHRRKSKQVAKAKGEAEEKGAMLDATIKGVEEFRVKVGETIEEFNKNGETKLDPDSVDAKGLAALKKVHKYTGYAEKISPLVKKVKTFL